MTSNVYSFLNFQAAITGPGGSVNIGNGSGASEEGMTFSPTGERSTMQIGADGSGQHSLHADKSAKITLRMLKTSPANLVLMAMANQQWSDASLHGRNVISATDTQRGDSITCTGVGFTKVPDMTYAKEAGTVDWEFMAIQMDQFLGS